VTPDMPSATPDLPRREMALSRHALPTQNEDCLATSLYSSLNLSAGCLSIR
jgi:hypothetical protein